MASTSTNKQPLLVDRVFHIAIDANPHKVTNNPVTPGNDRCHYSCSCWSDCWWWRSNWKYVHNLRATAEVALINYTLVQAETTYVQAVCSLVKLNHQMMIHPKYLKRNARGFTSFGSVAHAGDEPQMRALYVPKGIALWAGVELR